MKTKHSIVAIISFFLLVVLCLFVIQIQAKATPVFSKAPGISAHRAALYDPSSASFLYEKNKDVRAPMASTTKIMTALVVLESLDLTQTVSIPKDACGIEGSSLYLTEGEKWTVEDLLYGLMLRSANDAAVALALTVSSSTETFAEKMNAKAEQLSLFDTHYVNPHGLDDPEHFTTAHDLAILAAYALQNASFRRIVSTVKYTAHPIEGDPRAIVNHNKLLRIYDKATGIKTGFTKKAGRCLVSSAETDGMQLICVTLSAADDWNDHIKLYRYGFFSIDNRFPAE